MSLAPKAAASPNAPGMIPKRRPPASGMMDLRSWRVLPLEKSIMACLTIGMHVSYVSRLATSSRSITRMLRSILVRRAISNDRGGDGLGESHILAAQFDVEASVDSLIVEMPTRGPGGPMRGVAAQAEFNNITLPGLAAQRASRERRMPEDGKFGGEVV